MNLVHIVAACAALLTFVVAGRALASRSTFGRGQSWFIAAITALLGFLGLINLGEDWARMVLIPYAALVLAVLLVSVLMPLLRKNNRRRDQPEDDDGGAPPAG